MIEITEIETIKATSEANKSSQIYTTRAIIKSIKHSDIDTEVFS